jgi:hypothetical protein
LDPPGFQQVSGTLSRVLVASRAISLTGLIMTSFRGIGVFVSLRLTGSSICWHDNVEEWLRMWLLQ